MTDIYSLNFDPNVLSHKEEELGLEFADNDTAIDLMKKEEKMIVAELTLYYTKFGGYKNITELNGKIYSDKKFKDFFDRYEKTLKARNQSKIRFETFKAFRNDLRTKVVNERELAKNL
jgi:hypothetical protein|tara:strand:+ start:154 stop:507 length:354 start_codon:yes stop_codon:yes gene_type:complete